MRTGGAEDSHTGEGEGEPHACGDGLLVGNSKSSIVVARASSRPQLLAFVRPRTRAAGRTTPSPGSTTDDESSGAVRRSAAHDASEESARRRLPEKRRLSARPIGARAAAKVG